MTVHPTCYPAQCHPVDNFSQEFWRARRDAFAVTLGFGSELATSKLAKIPEEQYHTPDIDRANVEPLRAAKCRRPHPR